MTLLDRAILLLTGLVALYLAWRFWEHYRQSRKPDSLYPLISFAVLLVAGLLLIIFGYEALGNPLVIIVAVLIPAGISAGLVARIYPTFERPYLAFVLLGLVAIALTRFTGPATLATVVLIIVHSVAGLTIFFLPISAVYRRLAPPGYLMVTVGGALIGLGGIALAFLKTGGQLLFFSAGFVFAILAPLLLMMTLAFAWGFRQEQPAAA
jgi:hypothetical protein